MVDFEIQIDPNVGTVIRELEKSVEEISGEIMKDIADGVPDSMRNLMQAGGVSKKGEPPRRQTGTLANSIQAQVISSSSVEISFANHAQWLDPVFGGWLNRPFIEKGIDDRLEQLN